MRIIVASHTPIIYFIKIVNYIFQNKLYSYHNNKTMPTSSITQYFITVIKQIIFTLTAQSIKFTFFIFLLCFSPKIPIKTNHESLMYISKRKLQHIIIKYTNKTLEYNLPVLKVFISCSPLKQFSLIHPTQHI